jgi:hypothetical protein
VAHLSVVNEELAVRLHVELPGDETSTRDNARRRAYDALRADMAPSGDYLLAVRRDADGSVVIAEWISYRPHWVGGRWNRHGYWADEGGRWPDPEDRSKIS